MARLQTCLSDEAAERHQTKQNIDLYRDSSPKNNEKRIYKCLFSTGIK